MYTVQFLKDDDEQEKIEMPDESAADYDGDNFVEDEEWIDRGKHKTNK